MNTLTSKLSALLFAVLISLNADAANIELSNGLAAPGSMVTLTVTVDELPDRTTSIQGSLDWDEDMITLMDASAGVLSDMSFNTDNDDQLGFSWFSAGGVQLAGANALVSVTFQIAEDAEGRIMIAFGDNPTNLEIADAAFAPVAVEVTDGYIDVLEDLPVELAAFEATPANNSIQLAWNTQSEINFEGFEVQRSIDGSNFSTISWVNARGSEAQGASYGYTDNDAIPGKTYYYRLQMWDFDGVFEYSNVVSARIEGRGPVIDVFPNPTHHQAVLAFESFTEIAAPVLITINDNMGRLIQQLNYTAQTGKNIIHLNVSHFPMGMYMIRLEQGEYFATRKLIIQ